MLWIILAAILILILTIYFRKRKVRTATTSTSTAQTTLAPPLASPTGASGYRFVEILEKYTLADITNLQNVASDSENLDSQRSPTDPALGTGRCATALASLCFSTIEQVGLILRNDLTTVTVRNAIKGEGPRNAESFFSFFSSQGLQVISRAEIDAVYSLFRNKITHNIFPRYSLGVSLDSRNPINQLITSLSGTYSLNVNFLSNYILNAIPLLKNILSDITAHTGTILMVDQNAQLIDAAELTAVQNRYHSDTSIQPYFTTWLPGITF